MIKVSVIIPVYNAQEYLEQCLQSVQRQTMKELEILCINDGSTDDSLRILEEIRREDKRIRIFEQTNQGAGLYVFWMRMITGLMKVHWKRCMKVR